jgi:hypothetical protein
MICEQLELVDLGVKFFRDRKRLGDPSDGSEGDTVALGAALVGRRGYGVVLLHIILQRYAVDLSARSGWCCCHYRARLALLPPEPSQLARASGKRSISSYVEGEALSFF